MIQRLTLGLFLLQLGLIEATQVQVCNNYIAPVFVTITWTDNVITCDRVSSNGQNVIAKDAQVISMIIKDIRITQKPSLILEPAYPTDDILLYLGTGNWGELQFVSQSLKISDLDSSGSHHITHPGEMGRSL